MTRIIYLKAYFETERGRTTHWTCEQCWWRGRSPGSSPAWRWTRSSCRGQRPYWPAYTGETWYLQWSPSPLSRYKPTSVKTTQLTSSLKNPTYVFQSSAVGGEIVESVARDPHHRGEGHEESNAMGPVRILHGPILDWFPLEAVEEKDDPHDCWSNAPPA